MAMMEQRRTRLVWDQKAFETIRVRERNIKKQCMDVNKRQTVFCSALVGNKEKQNGSVVKTLTVQPLKYLCADFGCVGALRGLQQKTSAWVQKWRRGGTEFEKCTPKDRKGQHFGF